MARRWRRSPKSACSTTAPVCWRRICRTAQSARRTRHRPGGAFTAEASLLDEPMAWHRAEESERLIVVLQRPGRAARHMMLVEHDMNGAVFALADRIWCASMAECEQQAPAAVRVRSGGDGGLSWRGTGIRFHVENCILRPGAVLFDISSTSERWRSRLIAATAWKTTTTSSALMGLVPPTAGRVMFNGTSLIGLPPYAIAQAGIGLVPEAPTFDLPVEETRSPPVPRASAAQWTLDRVYQFLLALAARINTGNELSGGEQQMLAIGRAPMINPKIHSRRGYRRPGAEDPYRNLELPDQA